VDTLLVARYDLIRRVRNRSALFTAFVGPLALAVVFSLLIGGGGGITWTVAVVDLDRTDVSAQIVERITTGDRDGSDAVRFEVLTGRVEAAAAVDGGDADAAIVVPEGYSAAITAGRPEPLEVLRDPDQLIAGQIAQSVAAAVGQQVQQVMLVATVALSQDPTLDPDTVVAAASAAPPAITAVDVSMGEGEVSAGAHFGASMAVLFLFFTIGLAARSIVAERRTGTLARILATPARLPAVVAGKTTAVALLGLAGFVSTWIVTSVVFGAAWGSPPAVLTLMVATVVSVGGVAMFVASLAHTEQQAETYTATVAFLLAILGGNFIGPGAAPPLLRQLSRATPNGWALDGFAEVAIDGAELADVLPTAAVLVAIGVGFGAVGMVLLSRRGMP
jgi:ABC-2 type transport system permease protein